MLTASEQKRLEGLYERHGAEILVEHLFGIYGLRRFMRAAEKRRVKGWQQVIIGTTVTCLCSLTLPFAFVPGAEFDYAWYPYLYYGSQAFCCFVATIQARGDMPHVPANLLRLSTHFAALEAPKE